MEGEVLDEHTIEIDHCEEIENSIQKSLAEKESEVLSLIISNNETNSFIELEPNKNLSILDTKTSNECENIDECETLTTIVSVTISDETPMITEENVHSFNVTEAALIHPSEILYSSEYAITTTDIQNVESNTNVNISDNDKEVDDGEVKNENNIEHETELATKSVEPEDNDVNIISTTDNNDIIIDSDGTATIEFNSADAAWITLLDKFEYLLNEDRIRGYVDGEKNFLCLWERFQTSTMSSFCVRSSDRYYRQAEEGEEGAVCGRILKGAAKWSRLPLVPFDGVPFIFMDRKYFGCRLGGNERRNPNKGQFSTSRKGHSLKVGCPAEAEVLEVWRVPELMLSNQMKSNREKRRVKQALLAEVHSYILMEKFTRRYYVTLPLINKHQNHPVLDLQAGSAKYLHPKIIEKIYDLVNQGIYEKRVIKFMLEEFVQEYQLELGMEIQTADRAFYPTDRDISNHVRNARKASKRADIASLNDIVINEETVPNICSSETLTYSTEVVASNFPGIITTSGEVTFIPAQETDVINQQTNIVAPTTFNNENNSSNYGTNVETGGYITTTDVGTVSIDGIVPSDVMEYYQTDNTNHPTVVDHMKLLLDPCKRKPKKRDKKWPLKPYKLNRKQRDLKILLREEIQKSFAVMNVVIQEENDEVKLHSVLKKVKCLQRVVEGKGNIKYKRERKSGIQAMLHLDTENKNNEGH